MYPSVEKKSEFIQRYTNRGNDQKFISMMEENWENWISEIDSEEENGFTKVKMTLNNLEDEINYILISEGSFDFSYKNN
jgi:hypothetical protein